MDTDGNGVLSRVEFEEVCMCLSLHVSQSVSDFQFKVPNFDGHAL